ncbi:hypothetical protein [Brevundimonas sp.]|uniref:hypothetical protein n=1 Tax=Brevundimonas sp. TaxID=1871086 RepID=UPI001A2D5265|nr:hypothetical protein [Brevundimonas sp.]MBJ7483188.1 hypothetical protein [Brevundimonas sp.]
MPTLHVPPGAASLVEDDHPSHPVLIDHDDGARTRARAIAWFEDLAPAGAFTIEDERDVAPMAIRPPPTRTTP